MICSTGKLAGVPAVADWIDAQLIQDTKVVWEPIYGSALTSEEAVEILHNVGRLIDALQE